MSITAYRAAVAGAKRSPHDDTTADFGAILVYGPTASGLVPPTTVIPAVTLGGVVPTALAVSHG